MGGSSKSSTSSTTSITSRQTDKRVGAADQARVVTGSGKIVDRTSTNIRVDSADARIIEAALAGTRGLTAEALDFSHRQQAQSAQVIEQAIAGTQGELQGLQSLLKTGTAIALVVGAVAIFGRR